MIQDALFLLLAFVGLVGLFGGGFLFGMIYGCRVALRGVKRLSDSGRIDKETIQLLADATRNAPFRDPAA